jgi:prepilin-type N-terminal cleavage/methylation domain-containing protein
MGATSHPNPKAKRGRRRRSEAGFTLNEVMVTTAVFTIGMAGVLSLHTYLYKSVSLATDLSLASNIASSALEQLRMSDFDRVLGVGVCPPVDATFDLECWFDRDGQALGSNPANRFFTLSWVATPDGTLHVNDVTVQVTWDPDFDGSNLESVDMQGRVYPR